MFTLHNERLDTNNYVNDSLLEKNSLYIIFNDLKESLVYFNLLFFWLSYFNLNLITPPLVLNLSYFCVLSIFQKIFSNYLSILKIQISQNCLVTWISLIFWREWLSGLRPSTQIWMVLDSIPNEHSARLQELAFLRGSKWPLDWNYCNSD